MGIVVPEQLEGHSLRTHDLEQCFSTPVLRAHQHVMFSGFPSDQTAVVITKAVKLIKSPVHNNGKPENKTCWCAPRTGVEKHCTILPKVLGHLPSHAHEL